MSMATPSQSRHIIPAEFESLEALNPAESAQRPEQLGGQPGEQPEDKGAAGQPAAILSIHPADPERDASRNQSFLDLAFVQAVLRGDEIEAERLLAQGADVNCREPGIGATALHYAASRSMRPVLRILIRQPGLDYLATDRKRRLPSTYAWEISGDPVIGRFLVRKEVAQAHERGIDYRSLIGSGKRA
jgi:hypothetical protein